MRKFRKKILFSFSFFLLIGFVSAWSYPLHNIYFSDCNVGDLSCVIKLPIIKDADYEKYRYNVNYNKVYTMLWGTTYFDGKDIGMGSHQGLDLASKIGTPVYSIYDGKVIVAEKKGNRGLVITIEHEWKGKKIYSSYAHLNSILVKVGQYVKEGEIIAKLGNSGNTTGPHLHFQIEINSDGNHPFFYKGCLGTISEIINEGRCQKQMYENTIDPILFIEKKGNIPFNGEIINSNFLNITDYDLIKSVQFSGFLGGVINMDKMPILNITIPSYSGFYLLSGDILIKSDINYLDIFPNKINILGGSRNIYFVPKKEGISFVNLQYFNKKITTIPFVNSYNDINLLKGFKLKNTYKNNGWIYLLDISSLNFDLNKKTYLLFSINLYLSEIWNYKISLNLWFKSNNNLQYFYVLDNDVLLKKWLLISGKKKGNNIGNIVLINGNKILGKIEI